MVPSLTHGLGCTHSFPPHLPHTLSPAPHTLHATPAFPHTHTHTHTPHCTPATLRAPVLLLDHCAVAAHLSFLRLRTHARHAPTFQWFTHALHHTAATLPATYHLRLHTALPHTHCPSLTACHTHRTMHYARTAAHLPAHFRTCTRARYLPSWVHYTLHCLPHHTLLLLTTTLHRLGLPTLLLHTLHWDPAALTSPLHHHHLPTTSLYHTHIHFTAHHTHACTATHTHTAHAPAIPHFACTPLHTLPLHTSVSLCHTHTCCLPAFTTLATHFPPTFTLPTMLSAPHTHTPGSLFQHLSLP